MGLFELLFIAAFILLPIMEGVLKQRQKRQQGQQGRQGRQGRQGPGAAGPGRPGAGASPDRQDPRSAAEMLPDDLWELMTGERRSSRRAGSEGGDVGDGQGGGSPWSTDPSVATDTVEADAGAEEPWAADNQVDVGKTVSAEYTGPEAYSLETPAPPPIERTVPTAAARHQAFHAMIDRDQRPRRRHHLSPLMRALRSPEGLRQAVLLKEILGPPKGME